MEPRSIPTSGMVMRVRERLQRLGGVILHPICLREFRGMFRAQRFFWTYFVLLCAAFIFYEAATDNGIIPLPPESPRTLMQLPAPKEARENEKPRTSARLA